MSARLAEKHVRELTSETEAWKSNHEEVMGVYDLEDDLAMVLQVLEMVRVIEKHTRKVTVTIAQLLAEFYLAWYDATEHLVHEIRKRRESDYQVEYSDTFLKEHRDLAGQLGCIREQLIRINQIRDGKVQSLAEAFDEARRNRSQGSL